MGPGTQCSGINNCRHHTLLFDHIYLLLSLPVCYNPSHPTEAEMLTSDRVSADLALIYTLFGYMYALAVLRGDAQAARGWRTAGIVMIIITSVIMGVWFALYCVRTARLIGPYVSTPGLSSRYLVLAGSGINLAFDAIRLVLACVFLGFGIHALVRYRHSSNFSRIPLLLLVTTWPFYLFTMLAALATDVAWRYHVVSSSVEDSVPIITTITRFSFLVVVYSGLVASGRRPEWSQASGAAGPMQSGWRDPNAAPYNPGFDPTHFTLPQHQNQTGIAHTANQPTYGGGPPSTTTGMSGTTAHGAADSHYKPELPLNAAPYPELPNQYQNQQPQQHAMGGGYDPYYRGPQQRTSELPAGYHPYRGSPPPQSELPGALRAGSPPAPAELNSPRRF